MLFGPRKFSAPARIWLILVCTALVTALPFLWKSLARSVGWHWESGASPIPLWFGIAAGLIVVFESLLWVRKRLLRLRRFFWWLGSVNAPRRSVDGAPARESLVAKCFRALGHIPIVLDRWCFATRRWMALHIYLGLAAIPLAIAHSGFHFQAGILASWTLWLFLAVSASGIVGLIVQQVLPRRILDDVPGESIATQIDFVSKELHKSAEQLVRALTNPDPPAAPSDLRTAPTIIPLIAGSPMSVRLKDLFRDEITPYFLNEGSRPRRRYRLASREKSRALFAQMLRETPAHAQENIRTLERYCNERRDLDRQWVLNAWLHGWLMIHAPLTAVLLVALFWHAAAALKLGGLFE